MEQRYRARFRQQKRLASALNVAECAAGVAVVPARFHRDQMLSAKVGLVVPRPIAVPQRLIRSAGALVWRPVGSAVGAAPGTSLDASDIEVLLVHRPRYRDWSWPKGKAEHNEPLAQAAVREVEEETGQVVYLNRPLTLQRYRLGSGHTKEVHYWAAQALRKHPAKAARPPVQLASKKEIDQAKWCKPAKARQILTRRGDRRLLSELLQMASKGELTSSSIILLRHAKAKSREKWKGTEEDRPLTRMGGRQALDVPPLLSAFGADHLLSSPWSRCQQTVLPYAALTGLAVETMPQLTEQRVETHPEESSALVEQLLAEPTGRHVVSLHRPGLPALLDPIVSGVGIKRYPALTSPSSNLRTAEMFVVHVAHPGDGTPQILEVERHIPYTKLAGH